MKKTTCLKCNFEFTNRGGNYIKHFNSCNGTYKPTTKLLNCKYCNLTYSGLNTNQRANHSRWCKQNPARNSYTPDLTKARAAKKNFENQYTKAKKEGRQVPPSPHKGKSGFWLGKNHTEETKQKIKQKALNSPHRRLKKGTVLYKGVLLDSSWELHLAERLDFLNIKWVRPEALVWIDENGCKHNYFPDFYLPEYNLYLDPKNPWAIKVQANKLKLLLTQYPNIKIIESLEECRKFCKP
jgi:hypothetical protein